MSVSAARQPTKRGRPGYDLESILAIAVTVFNERGYEATGMEALARRLGITKSAIWAVMSLVSSNRFTASSG